MAGNVGGVTLDMRQLEKFAANLDKNVGDGLRELSVYVKAVAADRAPWQYGGLSNSIDEEEVHTLLRIVFDQVEYGIWQELGTSRMAAQPFMVPAIEEAYRFVAETIGENISK